MATKRGVKRRVKRQVKRRLKTQIDDQLDLDWVRATIARTRTAWASVWATEGLAAHLTGLILRSFSRKARVFSDFPGILVIDLSPEQSRVVRHPLGDLGWVGPTADVWRLPPRVLGVGCRNWMLSWDVVHPVLSEVQELLEEEGFNLTVRNEGRILVIELKGGPGGEYEDA